MSRRLSLVLLAVAAALVFALPGGARTAQTTLHGVVGPSFTISLTDDSGNRVTHLDPGTYTIDVKDQANIHNFDLQGPGVSQATDIEFVGSVTWTVTFTDGTYKYVCDVHTSIMHGSFTVGTVSSPPPPPPKPKAKKLLGSVGPGAKIAVRSASRRAATSTGRTRTPPSMGASGSAEPGLEAVGLDDERDETGLAARLVQLAGVPPDGGSGRHGLRRLLICR